MKIAKKNNKIIARELDHIKRAHGGLLRPEAVVEEARSKTSPLHSLFQWDDNAAAKAYRLWQARQLIVSVVYDFTDEKEQHVCVRYVSLPSDRKHGGGYRSLTDVVHSNELREELLESMLEDIRVFRQKYNTVKEAVTLLLAMDEVETSVRKGRRVKN